MQSNILSGCKLCVMMPVMLKMSLFLSGCFFFFVLAQDSIVKVQTEGELLFENSDFEKGTLDNWKATGNAFIAQPIAGDNAAARNRESARQQGNYWIGTYDKYNLHNGSKPGAIQGDSPTGKLRSIKFTIQGPIISFLIGGGQYPDRAYVALVVDGIEVCKAVGRTSEEMRSHYWFVSKWVGKTAFITINDLVADAESWGHINVDYFHYCNVISTIPTEAIQ